MIDTGPNRSPLSPNPVEQLLQGVECRPDFDRATLMYDEQLRGLVQPQEDGRLRLMMFRVQPEGIPLKPRATESSKLKDTVYGAGVYAGNSFPTVVAFGWKAHHEVNVYLTPPFTKEEVLDITRPKDSLPQRARLLGKQILNQYIALGTGVKRHIRRVDRRLGESKLVVMDMGVDVRMLQRPQLKPFSYPVRPAWYIWRDKAGELDQIGAVTEPPLERRAYARGLGKVASHFRKPPQT